MFNKTAFYAIFNLPNGFISTPFIVSSFMKAYGVFTFLK